MALQEGVKKIREEEKEELDYLLREFYELKNIFTLIKYAQEAKDHGESEHLKPIIEEILTKIGFRVFTFKLRFTN